MWLYVSAAVHTAGGKLSRVGKPSRRSSTCTHCSTLLGHLSRLFNHRLPRPQQHLRWSSPLSLCQFCMTLSGFSRLESLWKSGKMGKFFSSVFKVWTVLENYFVPGKSWNVGVEGSLISLNFMHKCVICIQFTSYAQNVYHRPKRTLGGHT